MTNRLIVHDIADKAEAGALAEIFAGDTVFSATPAVHHCVGCFGCWLKTPGRCVLKDRGSDFAAMTAAHEEIVIVSRLVFGGVSPDIKAVFDRSIGYVLPFFYKVSGETHHAKRYDRSPGFRYIFYGEDMTDREKQTAKKLAAANMLNLGGVAHEVEFCESPQDCLDLLAARRD
ncbi:MAG: flavodoxin family protein [Clostridiales Family XIII bacterium]|nr:flavodoxin family protein [Clostridiales Family XIII bacterium]